MLEFKAYDEAEFYDGMLYKGIPSIMLTAVELDITEECTQELYNNFIGAFDDAEACVAYLIDSFGYNIFMSDAVNLAVYYYNNYYDDDSNKVNIDDEDDIISWIDEDDERKAELIAEIASRLTDATSEITWQANVLTGNTCFFWC